MRGGLEVDLDKIIAFTIMPQKVVDLEKTIAPKDDLKVHLKVHLELWFETTASRKAPWDS